MNEVLQQAKVMPLIARRQRGNELTSRFPEVAEAVVKLPARSVI